MTERAMASCRRTSGLVERVLDGAESQVDRSHITTCAACAREAQRARRFQQSLAAAASEFATGIPAPPAPSEVPTVWTRLGRVAQPIARTATLAAAIVVGVVLAGLIGSRTMPPGLQAEQAFASADSARDALASLSLVCQDQDQVIVCQSLAPDHVHRVVLSESGDRVVQVVASIESIDREPIDLRGADDLFARIATAVLTPSEARLAGDWVRAAYSSCGAGCSMTLDHLGLSLAVDSRSATFVLRER